MHTRLKDLSYICVECLCEHSEIIDLIPDYPMISKTKRSYHNLLVFSMLYERYTYGNYEHLESANLKIHLCASMEDFVALVATFSLGADLSNLWSKT